MTTKDFVVSADGHIVEPNDLFRTRLPNHLRDRGFWEEDFEVEPLVEGGARVFRRLHTPGFEGWTISRYRQTRGRMPEGDPDMILDDMDLDGGTLVVRGKGKRERVALLGKPAVKALREWLAARETLVAGMPGTPAAVFLTMSIYSRARRRGRSKTPLCQAAMVLLATPSPSRRRPPDRS